MLPLFFTDGRALIFIIIAAFTYYMLASDE